MFIAMMRRLVNDHWLIVLLAWVIVVAGLKLVAPSWDAVALDGDLDYLPSNVTSRQGAQLLADAFPDDDDKSRAVLVFARPDKKLTVEDRQFALDLSNELGKRITAVRKNSDKPLLVDVWNAKTDVVHRMLLAPDGRAELVVARLTTGLMAFENIAIRDEVVKLIREWRSEAPDGLQIEATGSTLIGGDIRSATLESLANTERTTVVLVLICLIAIYRAPVLVLVPLATIAVSMSVSYDVVALLAENFGPGDFSWSNLRIFTTTKIFVVVILFGAGTDYCLFLISRYKEELGEGVLPEQAPGQALVNVSEALAGSAFTTILGLGTMAFAQYGKFANSGPVIGVCLFIALAACVTFAPALLRAIGPRVFWPFTDRVLQAEDQPDDSIPTTGFWPWLSDFVTRRPLLILAVSAWISAPLIFIGMRVGVTHDVLAELPQQSVSVVGARTVGEYFGAGLVSPMTVVAELPADTKIDLAATEGRYHIGWLDNELYQLPSISDVRSFYLPTGGDPMNRQRRLFSSKALSEMAAAGSPITADTFVSHVEPYKGRVTQISVDLAADPFSSEARELIPQIRAALTKISEQPTVDGEPNPWLGTRFELAGTAPGLFDLEKVTNSDRTRIQVCTVLAVLAVLLVLLRRPMACLYLILTVLLSYWATIGLTDLFFHWLYGADYLGLDWKVPIFLFVILIAVGQDYNIYLTTRVFEEQAKHGLDAGLRRAVIQTGGIITSCGVIMAGTFVSMATGSLHAMVELGFSLALGVLLDTFFVRTVIVPCYFVLVTRWKQRGTLHDMT